MIFQKVEKVLKINLTFNLIDKTIKRFIFWLHFGYQTLIEKKITILFRVKNKGLKLRFLVKQIVIEKAYRLKNI